MAYGIEIYDKTGKLIADGTNRLGRIVDSFQPNLGVGSKTYNIPADQLDFVYLQGNQQVLTVWKDGSTIRWNLADSYNAVGYEGPRQLLVVTY